MNTNTKNTNNSVYNMRDAIREADDDNYHAQFNAYDFDRDTANVINSFRSRQNDYDCSYGYDNY